MRIRRVRARAAESGRGRIEFLMTTETTDKGEAVRRTATKNVRIAVFALGIVAALVALAGCGSSKTHGEEGTLTLIEPPNSSVLTPFGNAGKGFAPGNGATVSLPLQNSGKTKVGELKAVCFDTQPASGEGLEGTCNGTAIVPGGTFALSAGSREIFTEAGVSGAITGGTGKYNGALGSFTSKPTNGNDGGSNLTFEYILP